MLLSMRKRERSEILGTFKGRLALFLLSAFFFFELLLGEKREKKSIFYIESSKNLILST